MHAIIWFNIASYFNTFRASKFVLAKSVYPQILLATVATVEYCTILYLDYCYYLLLHTTTNNGGCHACIKVISVTMLQFLICHCITV